MDSAEKKRKLLLGSALIATLIAVVLVGGEDEETIINTVEPVQSAKSSVDKTKAQESNSEYLDISKLGQRKFNPSAGELFASTTWTPKPPSVSLEEQAAKAAQIAKSSPPPAPTAPPLSFKYTGKAISGNETWVFLAQSGENLIAKIGGKINDKYRLDAITDEMVTMTYLPLNIKQTLTINNKIAGSFR